MIHSVRQLKGTRIHATDGPIGHITDVYFEDQTWAVRYLVVDTGGLLTGRSVLISPIAMREPEGQADALEVDLTRDQVRNSPDVDTVRPISRQKEIEYYRYYGWPTYWTGGGLWGVAGTPYALAAYNYTPPLMPEPVEEQRVESANPEEAHLRSTNAITGYHIEALDGRVGRVEDFLVDDSAWIVTGIVVDTTSWLSGGEVLVAPAEVEDVDWATGRVFVKLDREHVKHGPAYKRA
jgi:hypothetical protein